MECKAGKACGEGVVEIRVEISYIFAELRCSYATTFIVLEVGEDEIVDGGAIYFPAIKLWIKEEVLNHLPQNFVVGHHFLLIHRSFVPGKSTI